MQICFVYTYTVYAHCEFYALDCECIAIETKKSYLPTGKDLDRGQNLAAVFKQLLLFLNYWYCESINKVCNNV